MPRFVKVFFFFIILSILFYSCMLTDGSKYFIDVDKKPDLKNVASLNYSYDNKNYFPLKDTLWVSTRVYIRIAGGFVYDQEVSINNSPFIAFGSGLRDIVINKGDLKSSINNIKIKHRVKSGTGSLADKSQAEYAEYELKVILVVDNNIFVPKISNISFQDGTVKIKWNEYTRGDFQSYRVVKLIPAQYGGFREYRSFVIKNQTQTIFTDTTYVGGSINYQIVVNNGADVVSADYPFNYYYTPSVTLEQFSSNFRFSFTPPPFYKNVKYYQVSCFAYQFDKQPVATKQVMPNSLSMDIAYPLIFGLPIKFEISPMAKVEANLGLGDQWLSTSLTTYGKRIKMYNGSYVHDLKSPFYFCYVNDSGGALGKMYKIDDTTFEAIDSVSFPGGSFSTGGGIMISANSSNYYFLTSSQILSFDPKTMRVISTYPLASIENYPFKGAEFYNNVTTVTNNNLIYFSGRDRGTFPCVFDMNTKTTLFVSSNRDDKGHLSSDGKYLVIGSVLYERSGNTYSLKRNLPYQFISLLRFIDDSPSQLIIVDISKTEIYDCETNTVLFSTAATPSFGRVVYDQSTKKMLIGTALRIFDIPTRTFKPINVDVFYVSYSGGTFFTNFPIDGSYFVLKNY
jgi:hypothetical protein